MHTGSHDYLPDTNEYLSGTSSKKSLHYFFAKQKRCWHAVSPIHASEALRIIPPHISPYNIPHNFSAHMLFPPFHLISGIRLQTDYTPEKPISSHRKAFSTCPYRLSRVTRKPFSHVMKNFWRTSISQSSDIQQIILTRKNQPIQRQYVFRLSLRNSQRLYII